MRKFNKTGWVKSEDLKTQKFNGFFDVPIELPRFLYKECGISELKGMVEDYESGDYYGVQCDSEAGQVLGLQVDHAIDCIKIAASQKMNPWSGDHVSDVVSTFVKRFFDCNSIKELEKEYDKLWYSFRNEYKASEDLCCTVLFIIDLFIKSMREFGIESGEKGDFNAEHLFRKYMNAHPYEMDADFINQN